MRPLLLSLAFAAPALGQHAVPASPHTSFSWGDYDRDGHVDAFVLRDGVGRLLRNQGQRSFVDVSADVGLPADVRAERALWGDVDGDGRLDLLLVSALDGPRLLRQHEGTFVDATEHSGLGALVAPLDAQFVDYDEDGDPDLLATAPNEYLLLHNEDGFFTALDLGLAPSTVPVAPPVTPPNAPGAGSGPDISVGPGGGPGSGAGSFSICATSVEDEANPGNCMTASSVPTLGRLFPLSSYFCIDGGGNVGVGTVAPVYKLDVVGGDVAADGQLISRTASGAPLAVSSSDLVAGLNADLLDGVHASSFSQFGSEIDNHELADGAVTKAKIELDAIVTAHLSDAAVEGPKLAAGAVSAAHLAPDSVTASALAPGSVGSSELVDGSVDKFKIGAGAVVDVHIASGEISDTHIHSSAGIAGTKIEPDFGTQDIQTLGGLCVGTALPNVQACIAATSGEDLLRIQRVGTTRFFIDDTGDVAVGAYFTPTATMDVEGDFNVTYDAVGQTALRGSATDAGPSANTGVAGFAYGEGGRGVYGFVPDNGSVNSGVYGLSFSDSGRGVTGRATNSATNDYTAGVYGEAYGVFGRGVEGYTNGSSATAVRGKADGSSGVGVYGRGDRGVWGSANSGGVAIYGSGDLNVTGTKSFVQPHPTDPAKELRYVCLEGGEAGTYFRGKARLVDGVARIAVPEHFRMVSAPGGMTVVTTPIGAPALLWVESQDLETVVVRGDSDVEFSYMVNGVRFGYDDFEVVAENRSFRPRERDVPFAMQLPDEIRQLMVDNGTLNADFTPNETTAAALGWTLGAPEERRAEAALPAPPAKRVLRKE